MSDTPVLIEIDCLATARRILATPTGVYSATAFEVVALAACTVRESSGSMPELPVIADPPAQQLSASVAAHTAAVIQLFDMLATAAERRFAMEADENADVSLIDLREAHWDAQEAFDTAFNALKIRFEKEFPNGSA